MNNKNKAKLDLLVSKIINENIESIMAERFSRYSKYIIQQRAIPDVRDGLKPVQRRILYSMQDLGLQHNKPFKKSARVVGDVIGKYHPHGDYSIYDAMVRMAQDWKMGHTLLEMHGNVGSIDDDPAAAMRYTEVRLSKIADLVIGDLHKNTIKYAPNFDDSEKEPTVLPSLIPNLLVNGAKGIAAGFATEMPPHNLGEVLDATIAKIKNPDISFLKLRQYVKGPDFPTGGVIYGTSGINEALEKGRGRVMLCAKYEISEDKKNKFIEIKEIPFEVVKSKLVHDIDFIIAREEAAGLLEVKDQSDREGVSILLTLDKNADAENIMNYLFQKTQLKIYYNYNNVAIQNNTPKVLNLNQLLSSYIDHAKDVKRKALIYDVNGYKVRLEIVLGFLKVAEITNEVIEVIRNSENSKAGVIQNLIDTFEFTKNQATAIAEMRLYRLSRTDKNAFLNEKVDLEEKIARCELLLNDENEFNKFLINMFQEIKKEFATPRKTQIVEHELQTSYSEANLVKDEEIVLAVTNNGYLKRFSQKVADSNDFNTFGLKEEDKIIFYSTINTTHNLLLFTNLGNYALVPVYKINESKWKEFGSHLSEFVELQTGEEVVSAINVPDFNILNYVCLFSKKAQGKRVLLKSFEVSRISKTYTAMKLAEGDELIGAKLSDGLKDVLLITKLGRASLYSENEVQVYGLKSNGTRSCYMSPDDEICAFSTVEYADTITLLANESYIKRINVKDISKTSKTTLGKQLFSQLKTKPLMVHDCESTSIKDVFFVRNEIGEILQDKVVNYPISKTDEGFSRIKIDNIAQSFIKKAQIVSGNMLSDQSITNNDDDNESQNEKVNLLTEGKYVKETKREKDIIERANQEIKNIDLDVDDLLKKFGLD